MDWIFVIVAGLLEVLSINYMNKWQLIQKIRFEKNRQCLS